MSRPGYRWNEAVFKCGMLIELLFAKVAESSRNYAEDVIQNYIMGKIFDNENGLSKEAFYIINYLALYSTMTCI